MADRDRQGAARFGTRTVQWAVALSIPVAAILSAAFQVSREVAIFGNDATVPRARGRGAQTAIIQARLRAIAAMPFSCAAAEVAAGSSSERNYLRCGFELAYKRLWYSKAIPR